MIRWYRWNGGAGGLGMIEVRGREDTVRLFENGDGAETPTYLTRDEAAGSLRELRGEGYEIARTVGGAR